MRWTNPHVFIQVLVKNDKGAEDEWSIEMTSPEHLARDGWRPGTLKPGDKVTLVIHPMRDGDKGGQYLSGTGPGGPLIGRATARRAKANESPRDSRQPRRSCWRAWRQGAPHRRDCRTGAASGRTSAATPDPTGGFNQSLEQVLKELEWSPPLKPESQARVDRIVARERKRLEAMRRGEDPGGAVTACTFGYPTLMLESPLMFEILPTPNETALIFSSREIRHVYTDGREHPPKDDLWPTPWGDSIGHWEGQTLVIDTIAVKSPLFSETEGSPSWRSATSRDPDDRHLESARALHRANPDADKDHLENQMTIIDPANLTAPWHMKRTYERVAHIHRMVYEDCEGEERNPIVDGKFMLTPPPPDRAVSTSAERRSARPS